MAIKGFDYIRNANTLFDAKTPSASLRAIGTGLLPAEAFIYKSGSVKPLYEEPYDLEEIERVLSRPNLDLDSYFLLTQILERLINHEDSEIALFAAESINAIENRYNRRIEELKETLQITEDPSIYRELAVCYYEFALLNKSRTVIKNFYLKESFACYQAIHRQASVTVADLRQIVDILLQLDLTDQAAEILAAVQEKNPALDEFPLLTARIAFARKDYHGVIRAMASWSGDDDLASFWCGKHE